MAKRKKPRSGVNPLALRAGLALTALAVLAGAYAGVRSFRAGRALRKAEEFLQKGYGALAAETLDPVRYDAVRMDRGCELLISAYYQAQKAEPLEWASQACLSAGKESPEAYIGLAAVREFRGKDAEAIQILMDALPRFDSRYELYYHLAEVLRRNKRDGEAIQAYSQAMQRAPRNGQLAMEAMTYLGSLDKWAEAKAFAERIKDAATEDPQIKLLIARTYARAGDAATAAILAGQARELMAKHPERKQGLEAAYGDVLRPSPAPSAHP